MTRLRAQFDGKVLVPIGPVDLPTGKVLDVEVRDNPEPRRGGAQAVLKALRETPLIDPSIVDEWEQTIRAGEQPPAGADDFLE